VSRSLPSSAAPTLKTRMYLQVNFSVGTAELLSGAREVFEDLSATVYALYVILSSGYDILSASGEFI